ncbi:hypothetical protein S7335_59 [Synechococcus sp. PCC 7335]|uniref:hypothetical protein n=1 Tax=Synechococcus sp. (strain ATCC 29403 / PCC 7335) TaxID=91464 RepID=UPI00017EE106|nr:hypothetical protein [Synechococcus sp. PCC 7335]EDX82881.1 hypothetical protein S7335_59 [Synechococcus sp. PCC 7335]
MKRLFKFALLSFAIATTVLLGLGSSSEARLYQPIRYSLGGTNYAEICLEETPHEYKCYEERTNPATGEVTGNTYITSAKQMTEHIMRYSGNVCMSVYDSDFADGEFICRSQDGFYRED